MIENVVKRDGRLEKFNPMKIEKAVSAAFTSVGRKLPEKVIESFVNQIIEDLPDPCGVEEIQNKVENELMRRNCFSVAKAYILYREKHKTIRDYADKNIAFIDNFIKSDNTANATIDDNSNVSNHNIAVLNAELHKEDNQKINYRLLEEAVKHRYPEFDYKQMEKDFNSIMYLHDSSSQVGMPYCVAITMYPFLLNGIKDLGGLSAKPNSLESFCGIFINMVFAIAAQFKGAVATPGVFIAMDYFCRKEWGDDYYIKAEDCVHSHLCNRKRTVKEQILQYFQQITYSINQPASARGGQSVFWNVSVFDKEFYNTMYGDFKYPDGTAPQWESFNWLQKLYMHWLNQERLKCILTFPVLSVALIYKEGEFIDKELYEYTCKEYAEGNSFFTYINDSPESLSSCCFSKDTKFLWKASTSGVHNTTFEEFMNLPYENIKENYKIFHNGSWIKGKVVMLPNRSMYKVTTYNNKEFIMSDNHINVVYDGEKRTEELTTDDYLMFNTDVLHGIPEKSEHLTYEQGLLVGLFIGDGTFDSYICLDGSSHGFQLSLNKEKWEKARLFIEKLGKFTLHTPYNNVYPVVCQSKELTSFISKWTGNNPRETYSYNKNLNLDCLLQSVEFRQGILDGWYITDGGNSNRCYTTSKALVENMEILCTSLGLQTIIDISDRTDEKVIIRGIEYDRNHPLYCLRWYSKANHRTNKDRNTSWKKKNNSMFWRIKTIEKVEYTDPIYCIECDNQDEPYFTLPSGLITHNCRLSSKLSKPQFNFTNGQIGEMTGSKNVITLNLNRIVQNWYGTLGSPNPFYWDEHRDNFKEYLCTILDRVYKYQTAYNDCLMKLYDAGLLTVYTAGFIDLRKQYLTIGINGLNQAAEFLGIDCNKNSRYEQFCNDIFSSIKEQNTLHKTKELMFNTEFTPCESAAIKMYNRDKKDGYWVPEDTNLYASYIYKPNDTHISLLDKIYLHGRSFCGDNLDGGSAAHLNLEKHLSYEQYLKILKYAGDVGCKYLTFNVVNSECENCHYIAKEPFDICPKCGSKKVSHYDRVIG